MSHSVHCALYVLAGTSKLDFNTGMCFTAAFVIRIVAENWCRVAALKPSRAIRLPTAKYIY